MMLRKISNYRKLVYSLIILIITLLITLLININIDQRKYDQAMYNKVYTEYDEILNMGDDKTESSYIKTGVKNAKRYNSVAAILDIEKINIFYPIIANTTYDNLKISPTKFYGGDANEIGNFCIVGHNNQNSEQFSRIDKLEAGDRVRLTSNKGYTLNYAVYDKYIVEANDLSCTSQKTNGQKIVTLITCADNGKRRLVVKCKEV